MLCTEAAGQIIWFGDQNEDNIAYTYANSFEWLLDRERSGKRIHSHNGAGTDGN